MDKNSERRYKFGDPEDVKRFLRDLGLTVEEGVVKTVVQTIQDRTGKSLYDLWAHGRTRDGRERRPVCGRGTVEKIHGLYREGKLGPYLEYLEAMLDVDQEESEQQELPRSRPPDQIVPESQVASTPLVRLETDSEGLNLKPHLSASLLDPISVFPSVQNRGKEVIRYLQMHVWFPRGVVFWNPEVADSGGWRDEGIDDLPPQLQDFAPAGRFCRQVIRLAPETGFFIMPSSHPYALPRLELNRRAYLGMTPLPWQLEAVGEPTVTGALLLWCDEAGTFHSEPVGEDVDVAELWERNRRFVVDCNKRGQ